MRIIAWERNTPDRDWARVDGALRSTRAAFKELSTQLRGSDRANCLPETREPFKRDFAYLAKMLSPKFHLDPFSSSCGFKYDKSENDDILLGRLETWIKSDIKTNVIGFLFFFEWCHQLAPPAQGGSKGSVRLLLTKNPVRSFSCPICQVRGLSFERFPRPWQATWSVQND